LLNIGLATNFAHGQFVSVSQKGQMVYNRLPIFEQTPKTLFSPPCNIQKSYNQNLFVDGKIGNCKS